MRMRPASLMAAAPPSSCNVIHNVTPMDASASASKVATTTASLVVSGHEETGRTRLPTSTLSGHHIHTDVMHDPHRPADQEQRSQCRIGQCHDIPALPRRHVDMQKEHEMHDNLHEGENGERDHRGLRRERDVHDKPESSRGQHNRQYEAGDITTQTAVTLVARK